MGLVKQRWLELEAKHLSHIPDKKICIKHFTDKSITNFIRKHYSDGYCDYCEKNLKVVEFEDLMNFIMDSISNFYEDAANFMSYNSREGGYLGEIYTADELIQEQIGLNAEPFEVIEDIVNSIDEIAWSQPDLYNDNIKDELEYQWQYFKDIIKHRSRYLFHSRKDDQTKAFRILQAVGGLVSKQNIIRLIPQGTNLYRCRQHDSKTAITAIKQIVSPPKELAIHPNRFSPSGISMFYSAFDPDTAMIETISRHDKTKKYVTIAEFQTLKDCYIVDFTRLPKIKSIFGIKDKKNHYLNLFLLSFVRDITKPIQKNGKEHTEYVPTQVVTEYLRYPFNMHRKYKIEGIIYRSAQKENCNSSVFFWDNNLSLEKVRLNALRKVKIK
jgi:HEPN/RES N-terminal domain 1/RES domain